MTKKKSALTRTKHMNATYFQHNSVSLTTAAARTWCLLYAKSYYFVNIEVY